MHREQDLIKEFEKGEELTVLQINTILCNTGDADLYVNSVINRLVKQRKIKAIKGKKYILLINI